MVQSFGNDRVPLEHNDARDFIGPVQNISIDEGER